jgi:hypothetical protein
MLLLPLRHALPRFRDLQQTAPHLIVGNLIRAGAGFFRPSAVLAGKVCDD